MSCGTSAGYQAHWRRQEPACDQCKAAYRSYIAEWRRKNPASANRDKRAVKRRQKALAELARRHPDEYKAIWSEVGPQVVESS